MYVSGPEHLSRVLTYSEALLVDADRGFVLFELEDAEALWLEQQGETLVRDAFLSEQHRTAARGVGGIPGFECYATVEETFAQAEAWAQQFPGLVQWVDIGDSWEKINTAGGYDLMVLLLTNQAIPGDKPPIFIMSSMHAREYTPAGLNLDFARMLIEGYGVDADITWLLDYHEVHLLLQANPDGRKMAEQGFSWRKNKNNTICSDTSNRGVDLNRNYGFMWGFNTFCAGSSECNITYRGPSPESEPETQAVINYTRSIFEDQRGDDVNDPAPDDTVGVFIDVHSFGRWVLWPYGFDAVDIPNGDALQTFGRKLAWYNDYSPEPASLSFVTCGTTDDFHYGDLGVASFTFELGFTFFESCNSYESSIKQDNLDALLYAAKSARAPYLWPSGPNTESITLDQNSVFPGTSVTVGARVSEARFNNSVGTEPQQDVEAAHLYIDTPPWEVADGSGQPMTITDASDPREVLVSAEIDTTALPVGRRTFWIVGRDASGSYGTPTAGFLTILGDTPAILEGRVWGAGSGPLEATIVAGSFQTTANAEGVFSLSLTEGSYDVTVSAAGFAPRTYSNLQVNAGTTIQDVVLIPLCETPLTLTPVSGDWARVTEGEDQSWQDSPGRYYGNGQEALLLSQPIRNTRAGRLMLDHGFDLDTPGGDRADIVLVDADGSQEVLFRHQGVQSRHLQEVTLPDRSAPFRIGFKLWSDQNFDADGWSVFDANLLGANPDCAQAALYEDWPQQTSVLDMTFYINQLIP